MLSSVLTTCAVKYSINSNVIKPFFKAKQPKCVSLFARRFLSCSMGPNGDNPISVRPSNVEPASVNTDAKKYAVDSEKYPIFNNINYEEVAGNDEKLLEQLKVVVSQMQRMALQDTNLPSRIKVDQWHELLERKTFLGRLKYLRYLFITELRKNKDQMKKEERRKRSAEWLKKRVIEPEDPDRIVYGLSRNSPFIRIYDTSLDTMKNFKLIQAMMFGPKLVIDCSYDEFMIGVEITSCAKQISFFFGANRAKQCPVDLHLANFNPEGKLAKYLHRAMPTMYEAHFPLNWSPKSYLDLFPKEKLVYLTPHCEECIDTFNSDDIYIIGAMVDKNISEPLSLTKAQRDGVRYAKLPLDRFLAWGLGGKSLTVDQAANIVGDSLMHGSLEQALKTWVPSRKLAKTAEDEVSSTIQTKLSTFNLKSKFKRNLMLYEFLLNEENGDKVKSVKGKWPM